MDSFDFAVSRLIKQVKGKEGHSQVNRTSSPESPWKLDGRGWQTILSQAVTIRFLRKFTHVQPAVGKIASSVPLRFQLRQTSSSAEGTILVEGAVPEETIDCGKRSKLQQLPD